MRFSTWLCVHLAHVSARLTLLLYQLERHRLTRERELRLLATWRQVEAKSPYAHL